MKVNSKQETKHSFSLPFPLCQQTLCTYVFSAGFDAESDLVDENNVCIAEDLILTDYMDPSEFMIQNNKYQDDNFLNLFQYQ